MLKRLISSLLLPIMLILSPNQLLSKEPPSSSGAWEPDPGGAYLQYDFSGGTIESISKSSTHRNLVMEGTVRPGELLSISLTGIQPGHDTATTTIQSTLVTAYIKTNPRAESKNQNEAEEQKKFDKTGAASVSASYLVPKNVKTITAFGYIKPSWFNMNGGYSATYSVQVNYQVVEKSEQTSQAKPKQEVPLWIRDKKPVQDPKRQDSGVRFSRLSGEVSVRPNEGDDDSYEFAELDMILYNGDRIRTIEKSGAVLNFSDLSTFVMREDTIIILDVGNEKKSKISLVLGRILVNMERMIRDGNMDIEMSQACAGIKGTIFICEEDGKTSRVKVLEGRVSFTSNSNNKIMVSGGEKASATNGKASRASQFNIEDELKAWDSTTRDRIIHDLKARRLALGIEDADIEEKQSPSPTSAGQNSAVEHNALKTANAWVLVERKPIRGNTPAPTDGGEVRVEFGEDVIEMLLASPYEIGSHDPKNPRRLHARYSWTMPKVIQPNGQLLIPVKQEVLSNKTGKWASSFGVGILIANNWEVSGKTSDGTAIKPWTFGIGNGRPDWMQRNASVTYERTWLWNEGRPGDKRVVSVSVQGIGTQKIEYTYEWKTSISRLDNSEHE